MNIFSKLKIGARLFLSFGVFFAVVIIGSIIFCIYQINLVNQNLGDATAEFNKTSLAGVVADIEQIVRVIRDVNEIVMTIAAAIQEQSMVTQDIAGNIAQASIGVRDANMRVVQTAIVSGSIAKEIAEVSTSAGQIASASTQVQTSTIELSQLAEQLRQMVAQFKV